MKKKKARDLSNRKASQEPIFNVPSTYVNVTRQSLPTIKKKLKQKNQRMDKKMQRIINQHLLSQQLSPGSINVW